MGQDVYDTGWGNLSTEGLGATVRSGNLSRDSGLNIAAGAAFIIGALMTQNTTDSAVVSPVAADADDQLFIAVLLDSNSVKVDLIDGVVQNFVDANAFTMATKGLIYAAFDADQVDENNQLLFVDINGVFGLYASDPGAGFTPVTSASNIKLPDNQSIEIVGVGSTHNTVTYTSGITYRLVDKS